MPYLLKPGSYPIITLFRSDARHYQLSFLFIFLLTGLFQLNWSLPGWQIPLTFLVAVSTQYAGILLFRLPIHSLKSAFITSFSLCLLFRSDHHYVIVMAAFIAIASKFIFTYKGKHFFNPANIGICSSILISGSGWISPGQWGSEGLWLFLVGILGFLVVSRARRMELALSFMAAYGGAFLIRLLIWQNWPADALTHLLTSGTLLLFTFFMITDPASTPSHKTIRILWAFAVGLLAFYLQAYHWINGAVIWALFMLSPLTPLLDYFFKGETWSWQDLKNEKTSITGR